MWDLGDGTKANHKSIEHTYKRPGFYRVGVNAIGTAGSELAFRDLYVTDNLPEQAADATRWDFERVDNLKCTFERDGQHRVAGEDSVHAAIDPYHGFLARMLYPRSRDAGWSLASKTHLVFWMRAINPNLPGWQSNNPEITLYENNDRHLRLTPKRDLF